VSELPRHRLSDLLGMHVRFADGRDGDNVVDVRLAPGDRVRGQLQELVSEGLIIGRRRPGTLFGYDRDPQEGPWVIRALVRLVHRRTGYLEWGDVEAVDWEEQTVRLRVNGLRRLQPTARG